MNCFCGILHDTIKIRKIAHDLSGYGIPYPALLFGTTNRAVFYRQKMLPEPAEQTVSHLPPERQQRRYNGQGRRGHGNIGNDFLGQRGESDMQKTIRLPFPAADPFILCAADGRYYLYCTSEDGSGFPIYTSEDLQLWERCGTALGKETSRWGVGCF